MPQRGVLEVNMIAAITVQLIEKLQPKETRYDVRDAKLKGFMVRVFPSGRMSYRCEYARGKQVTIADVRVLSVIQARGEARRILGDLARGLDPAKEKRKAKFGSDCILFKDFLAKEYVPWLKAHRPDTAQEMITRLENSFLGLLGRLPLEEIKPLILEKWRLKRFKNDGVQGNTVNRQVALLKAALSRAKKWGLISENPLLDFEMAKFEDTSRMRFLSSDEYIALMQALDTFEENLREGRDRGNKWRKTRDYELKPDLRKQTFASDLIPKILISLGSGIRKCELRRIRREKHIDFERQGLKLTKEVTKTKKPRFIPLDDKMWKTLTDWLEQTKTTIGNHGYVFPGEDGKSQFGDMKKSWKTILKLAKIENFTWHDMRHDYASQLVMADVDLNTVRELLGHADIKMTLVYAHLAPEHKAAAVNKLGNRRKKILLAGKSRS
jgi:integrase